MNLVDFLTSVPELAGLSAPQLEVLERALVVREYGDGYTFIREGERSNGMYILLEGEVAVSRRERNNLHPIVIRRLQPGEIFGLNSLIGHSRRTATCVAVGKVRVASLPHNAFELLYQSDLPLSQHFLKIVAHQLVRDMRGLTGTIRQAMFSESHEEAKRSAHEIAAIYAHPERRMADRRSMERRRSYERRSYERRAAYALG